MPNDILCPIDFSEQSKTTLKWAARFSTEQACGLTILFTYRIMKGSDDLVAWKNKVEADAVQKFITLEQEWLKASGVHYSFLMEVGFMNDRVEAFVKKNPIRYLVLDRTGYADRDAFDHMVSHLKAPLVIVPQDFQV